MHPTIFVKYASENSMDWNAVQRDFASLGIHVKNTGQKGNDCWKARVRDPDDKKKDMTIVTGWLVPKVKLGLEADLAPTDNLELMGGS